jgi:hypothetical protein
VAERQLPKLNVAGSIPVSRSISGSVLLMVVVLFYTSNYWVLSLRS